MEARHIVRERGLQRRRFYNVWLDGHNSAYFQSVLEKKGHGHFVVIKDNSVYTKSITKQIHDICHKCYMGPGQGPGLRGRGPCKGGSGS
jgi:hypothetical protein